MAHGNDVWFGYWENEIPKSESWSWNQKQDLKEFLALVEKEWDDEDSVAGSPRKGQQVGQRARVLLVQAFGRRSPWPRLPW